MANDFSGSNACALWTLDDSGGLVLTDDIGGNDLTDANTVGQDTSDYKEGNGCADFEFDNTEALYITDGDLDAGFPGKDGTSEQDFSICFWVQLESLNIYQGCVSKWDAANNERRYMVRIQNDNYPIFYIGYNAGQSATGVELGTVVTTGVWYHIGATYTASSNAMKLRVWDDNAGALLDSNATGTAGGDWVPGAQGLVLGGVLSTSGNLDGQLDEVVVFAGEALSDADIDKIRAGTYGAAAGVAPTAALYGPLVGPLGGPI